MEDAHCVGCGATYHLVYAAPKKDGICDVCGGELILRDDDKPETVEKRLHVYHDQTQPLIDYYTKMREISEKALMEQWIWKMYSEPLFLY